MNAPAAPLVARLRAEIADLRQQLEECKLEAREEGARLAIAVAEFKADENGHITLRALDAWEGETGNLYYAHHPVPPEGAGHD